MTHIEAELVNRFVKQCNSIFDRLTDTIPQGKKEEVYKARDAVAIQWNGCINGECSIANFEKALSAWATIQLEVIDLARPAPKLKRQYKTRLTKMQEDFVDYYRRGCSAAKAARQAGYSPRTARQVGYELLRKPHIARLLPVQLNKLT
jgi:DNA-binding CsgD family transcriptional regulator